MSSAIKILQDVLAEIKMEADKSPSFGGQLGVKLIEQLSRQIASEAKINPELELRIAEIILPDILPDPVAIYNKGGEAELRRRLKKLNVTNLKTVAKKNKLAGDRDFKKNGKSIKKNDLIDLLVERVREEAGYSKGI